MVENSHLKNSQHEAKENDIQRQLTAIHTPQQNGVVVPNWLVPKTLCY